MSSSDITKSSFENNISDNCNESNSTTTTATHTSSSLSKNETSRNDVARSTAANSEGNDDKAAAVNKDDAAAPSTDGVEGQFGTIESSLEPNPVPTLKPSERKILLETSDSNDAFDGASPSNAATPSESGNSATSPTNSISVENSLSNINNSAGQADLYSNLYTAEHPLTNVSQTHANDVLYGRGGGTNHHPGNKRYRKTVEDNKNKYYLCKRLEKPLVALEIIKKWRTEQDPPGRFLKCDEATGLWSDVGDKKAREKTSQALRERAPSVRKAQQLQQQQVIQQKNIDTEASDPLPRLAATDRYLDDDSPQLQQQQVIQQKNIDTEASDPPPRLAATDRYFDDDSHPLDPNAIAESVTPISVYGSRSGSRSRHTNAADEQHHPVRFSSSTTGGTRIDSNNSSSSTYRVPSKSSIISSGIRPNKHLERPTTLRAHSLGIDPLDACNDVLDFSWDQTPMVLDRSRRGNSGSGSSETRRSYGSEEVRMGRGNDRVRISSSDQPPPPPYQQHHITSPERMPPPKNRERSVDDSYSSGWQPEKNSSTRPTSTSATIRRANMAREHSLAAFSSLEDSEKILRQQPSSLTKVFDSGYHDSWDKLQKTEVILPISVHDRHDSSNSRNNFRSSSLSPPSSDKFFEDTSRDYPNTGRKSSHRQPSYDNGNGGAYERFGIPPSSMIRRNDSMGSVTSLNSQRGEHYESDVLPQKQQHSHRNSKSNNGDHDYSQIYRSSSDVTNDHSSLRVQTNDGYDRHQRSSRRDTARGVEPYDYPIETTSYRDNSNQQQYYSSPPIAPPIHDLPPPPLHLSNNNNEPPHLSEQLHQSQPPYHREVTDPTSEYGTSSHNSNEDHYNHHHRSSRSRHHERYPQSYETTAVSPTSEDNYSPSSSTSRPSRNNIRHHRQGSDNSFGEYDDHRGGRYKQSNRHQAAEDDYPQHTSSPRHELETSPTNHHSAASYNHCDSNMTAPFSTSRTVSKPPAAKLKRYSAPNPRTIDAAAASQKRNYISRPERVKRDTSHQNEHPEVKRDSKIRCRAPAAIQSSPVSKPPKVNQRMHSLGIGLGDSLDDIVINAQNNDADTFSKSFFNDDTAGADGADEEEERAVQQLGISLEKSRIKDPLSPTNARTDDNDHHSLLYKQSRSLPVQAAYDSNEIDETHNNSNTNGRDNGNGTKSEKYAILDLDDDDQKW
eukprot:CAMPEP_0194446446 /NCGR_PEP_ID=MMETSP0176-20130528/128440_1 /TAXON_ID=216777 /ORGANISM="Proboscia alata, Strain PI-D3" /LENGTH=1179 /DNA_ID=CAMNT_0039273161 /DNA_START=357 /DNA_END=3892 /DNA_ORIENTATION=-